MKDKSPSMATLLLIVIGVFAALGIVHRLGPVAEIVVYIGLTVLFAGGFSIRNRLRQRREWGRQ